MRTVAIGVTDYGSHTSDAQSPLGLGQLVKGMEYKYHTIPIHVATKNPHPAILQSTANRSGKLGGGDTTAWAMCRRIMMHVDPATTECCSSEGTWGQEVKSGVVLVLVLSTTAPRIVDMQRPQT